MKNYVPTTLDQYINESKSITLKRGYKDKRPVVVGANAPIRNQVLAFVAESSRVRSAELKRFVAGLNETNANPAAAANMWLRRNGKFFVTESRKGVTYYKLSPLGQRLVNSFAPRNVNESDSKKPAENVNEISGLIQKLPKIISDQDGFYEEIGKLREQYSDFDEQLGEVPGKDKYKDLFLGLVEKYSSESDSVNESGKKKYDFKDPKTDKPGIVDDEDSKKSKDEKKSKKELEECGVKEGKEEDKGELTESRRKRIKEIIENIRSRNEEKINEEEAVKEEKEEEDEGVADELSFDDLDLEGEGEEKEEKEDSEEDADLDLEDTEEEDAEEDTEDEKVEITEFILTVDDVDAALEELSELGVNAEKVVDPDAEPEEGEEEAYKDGEISVPADDWDSLRGWLEEKGVDVEEMFGGEIEVEDEVEDEEGLEVDIEDEGDDLELDLGDEEGDELELDLGDEGEEEVEESLTGMENHEDDTNNLIKGAKQVVITYK